MNRKCKYIFNNKKPKTTKISKNIKISAVKDISDFRDFYKVSREVYKNNKYWVPEFWGETKNFFKTKELFWKHAKANLFIAFKNNKPVGRIASFIDKAYSYTDDEKIGFFGFFECINNYKIASALFNETEKWLRSQDITDMQGPINGRVDVGAGFVIKGFEHLPYLIGHYSQPYYINFAEKYKFRKSKDLISYKVDLTKPIPSKVKETAKRCQKNGINVRSFNRFKLKSEMDWWLKMFMEEFSDHWGYTDISLEEVKNRFGIKQLPWILDSNLFLVAEIYNKPIGFRWSLPDYNQIFKKLDGRLGLIALIKVFLTRHKINRGRFIIMGIKKKYQGRGIGTCLNYHTLVEMKKRGYKSAEYGWIDENNIASCKAAEKIGGKHYKTYRVYEKKLI